MLNKRILITKQFLADKLGVENTTNFQVFFGGVFWSTAGIFISSGIMFVASALAGRAIGPLEYGKYGLIVSVSAILSTFMSFGFSVAVIKYASAEDDTKKQGEIFTYSLLGLLAMFIFTAPIIYLSRNLIANFLNTSVELIDYAWLISAVLMTRTLLESFLIARKKYKMMSFMKVAESFVVLISFLIFANIFSKSYLAYYWPLCLGSGLSIIAYCIIFAKSFQRLTNLKFAKKIFQYQAVNIGLMLIGVVLNNIDKLFISRYLSAAALGIYTAYLAASLLIFSQIAMSLYNVLFSSMTKIEDKTSVVSTINRFFLKYIGIFIPIIAAITFIVMKFYGRKFGIDATLIVLFSFYAYLYVWASCFSGIVGSSKALMTYSARFSVLKPILLLFLYYLLVLLHAISIYSIVIIMIISYIYDIFAVQISLKYYKRYKA